MTSHQSTRDKRSFTGHCRIYVTQRGKGQFQTRLMASACVSTKSSLREPRFVIAQRFCSMIPSRPDSSDSHGWRDLTNSCETLTPEQIEELFIGTAIASARLQMFLRGQLAFSVQLRLLPVATPCKAVPRRRIAHVVDGAALCTKFFFENHWAASRRPSLCLSMRVKTVFCSALDRNKLTSQTLSPNSSVVIDYFQIFK